MRTIKDEDIFKLVVLRGLGYNQSEIAKMLGVSQTTITYRLGKIKKLSQEKGVENVFRNIVCKYINCPIPEDTVCIPRCIYKLITEEHESSYQYDERCLRKQIEVLQRIIEELARLVYSIRKLEEKEGVKYIMKVEYTSNDGGD